jgi:hypothetical protein
MMSGESSAREGIGEPPPHAGPCRFRTAQNGKAPAAGRWGVPCPKRRRTGLEHAHLWGRSRRRWRSRPYWQSKREQNPLSSSSVVHGTRATGRCRSLRSRSRRGDGLELTASEAQGRASRNGCATLFRGARAVAGIQGEKEDGLVFFLHEYVVLMGRFPNARIAVAGSGSAALARKEKAGGRCGKAGSEGVGSTPGSRRATANSTAAGVT